MAGIGDDIKAVLEELGSSTTIYKYGGTTITEVMDLETFPTSSTEFIRQYFGVLSVAYDSAIAPGDIVFINNCYYLVILTDRMFFENAPVDITVPACRCNVYGSLKRLSTVTNADYIKVPTWTDVTVEPLRALQYEDKSGNFQEIEGHLMSFNKEQHSLLLPVFVPVQVDDRWYPSHSNLNEFYRISSIDTRRFENVSICALEEDTR